MSIACGVEDGKMDKRREDWRLSGDGLHQDANAAIERRSSRDDGVQEVSLWQLSSLEIGYK